MTVLHKRFKHKASGKQKTLQAGFFLTLHVAEINWRERNIVVMNNRLFQLICFSWSPSQAENLLRELLPAKSELVIYPVHHGDQVAFLQLRFRGYMIPLPLILLCILTGLSFWHGVISSGTSAILGDRAGICLSYCRYFRPISHFA